MSKVTANAKRVMELLLEGKVEQARRFIEKDITKQVEDLRAQLTELNRERTVLTNMMLLQKGEQEPTQSSIPSTPQQKRSVGKEERSALIKQYAHEAAKRTTNRVVTLSAIVTQLESDGIDLGTEVPGTAIGNVLFKSSDWKRVERGVFQYVGPQLDLRQH